MIPVPEFDSVRCAWIDIRSKGFTLHGFILFLTSDHWFPEYLAGEGLGDLDHWSGEDCAIFIVQSPSAEWIEYAKAEGHPWWDLFGRRLEAETEDSLRRYGNSAVVEIDGSTKTLREVFAPPMNQFYHTKEIRKILHRFNLAPTDHPCFVLFKDLSDRTVWHIGLKDLVDVPQRELRRALQNWFSGPEFHQLLRDAQSA
jgi:hypothetical protein